MCGCRYTDTRKHITTSIDIQYISHTHRSPAHGGYQGAVLRDGMVEGTTLLPQRACLQARDLDLWPDGSSMNDELRGWRGVVCYTECSVCNDLLRSQYVHMWWNCMEMDLKLPSQGCVCWSNLSDRFCLFVCGHLPRLGFGDGCSPNLSLSVVLFGTEGDGGKAHLHISEERAKVRKSLQESSLNNWVGRNKNMEREETEIESQRGKDKQQRHFFWKKENRVGRQWDWKEEPQSVQRRS